MREFSLNDFNSEQISAIFHGVKWGVDVSKIVNPNLDAQQILEIIENDVNKGG